MIIIIIGKILISIENKICDYKFYKVYYIYDLRSLSCIHFIYNNHVCATKYTPGTRTRNHKEYITQYKCNAYTYKNKARSTIPSCGNYL